MAPPSLLTIADLSKKEIQEIVAVAIDMKANRDAYSEALKNDTLLMLFEKVSLRTRVSLETGMHQMGGHGIYYNVSTSPIGEKETIEDTAKVLSRMVQGITARVKTRNTVRGLASNATIPVINALDDYAHPLQMLADSQTIAEKFNRNYEGLTMAYFGDLDNNMTFDLMRLCAILGINFRMAGAATSDPPIEPSVWDEVNELLKVWNGKVTVTHEKTAEDAMKGVNIVYCDSWMSYGISKADEEARIKLFMPYQVTEELMKLAAENVVFMNCLPAARGMEQTAGVIDGPKSIVFDQAENRLHAQKALLLKFLRPEAFEKALKKLQG